MAQRRQRSYGAPRRAAGKSALAAALALALLLPAAVGTEPAQAAKKPNIVFVMTDDQTMAQFSERTMPRTHKLLVRQGTTFSDYIVTSPICCPSRGSLITGQYAHNHGVGSNNLGYRALRQKRNVLPAWLQRAGYRTGYVGKFMNKYEGTAGRRAIAPGWDSWTITLRPRRYYDYTLAANGKLKRFGSSPNKYLTRVLSRRTNRLARNWSQRRKPFFLKFAPYAPHRGGGDRTGRCEGTAVPDPRDENRFRGEPLPQDHLAPEERSFNELDVSDKPSFVRALPSISQAREETIRQRWGCQLASLLGVDRAVKSLVRTLRRTGSMRNTMIVFSSDNGFYFGEHRFPGGKHMPYEEGVHMPLVVRGPRSLAPAGERTIDLPVGNIDLVPTFLDLARGTPCIKRDRCRVMDGRSIAPLLAGDATGFPADRALGIEFFGRDAARPGRPCAFQGVRTDGEVLVEHIQGDAAGECAAAAEYEHYDLGKDPLQLENRLPEAGVGPGTPRQLELLRRMRRIAECSGVAGRDPRPNPGFYCE